jgi:hypothetical protein
MSGGWYLFLFLFILGVVTQGFNQMGIWDVKYASSGYQVTADTLNATEQGAANSDLGIFVIYTWIYTFVVVFFSGILAVLSVAALFHSMGWPIGIVGDAILTMIQLPANLIMFAWIFELWTGRQV